MKVIDKIYDFENGDKYVVETKECLHCKQTDKDNIYKWEWMTCHALVKPSEKGGNQDELPF